MDNAVPRVIALLLPLLVPVMQAQDVGTPPSSPKPRLRDHVDLPPLPDSPFPQANFVLSPNRDAGIIPKPHTELVTNHEYTLSELIDIAERENPATRIAWEQARNAAVRAGAASDTYLPIITASALGGYQGEHGQNSSLGASVQGSGNLYGSVETVSLQWLLFDFGGRKSIVDVAKKLSNVSNIVFNGTHQQVIYAVSTAYYAYAAAVQRHHTSIESLANAREVEAAARARYNHGEGTVVETSQTRNLTAQAQFSAVNTQGAEEQAYAGLLAAMGISPLTTIRIAPVEHRALSMADLAPVDQIVRDALARRPDVLAAYNTVQASQASVRVAEVQNRPKIFMTANGAYVNGNLGLTAVPSIGEQLPTVNITGNQWNGTVLLGASVPIFDAHRRANAVRQAKNDEDKASATLDEVRLNAMREVVSAQIALKTSLASNEAAAVLKETAQTSYDAALDSYKQGVGTATVAVEAETHLFEAALAQDDAYTLALSAAATLAYATGQLGSAPR